MCAFLYKNSTLVKFAVDGECGVKYFMNKFIVLAVLLIKLSAPNPSHKGKPLLIM